MHTPEPGCLEAGAAATKAKAWSRYVTVCVCAHVSFLLSLLGLIMPPAEQSAHACSRGPGADLTAEEKLKSDS